MSDRTPWWYSGDDGREEDAGDQGDQGDQGTSMDWGAVLSGAARMVDWATSTVMAPHAEHVDPADHPQCVVCRTITLVGDPAGLLSTSTPGDAAPAEGEDEPAPPPRITWIPIVDRSADARD